ncbi:hypothetical protein BGX31_009153 [Mortierella sp. GBA43]|nr:hypothetical protein BGX31_009153 [Mortierella sp. GBA43]
MASASTSTSVVPNPPRSIFDVQELIEAVTQYLSPRDIIQCMATNKELAIRLEPVLWKNVDLNCSSPEPSALLRNRHHVRSLSVNCYDHVNLSTIANGLPDLIHLGDLSMPGSIVNNEVLPQLRSIYIGADEPEVSMEWQEISDCLDCIIRILNQSPNLTHVIIPGLFLDKQDFLAQRILNVIKYRLPHLQHLSVRGDKAVEPEIGLEFLRTCFTHPQLFDLDCDFNMGDETYPNSQDQHPYYDPGLDTLLTITGNNDKSREALGKHTAGTHIKTLTLPWIQRGYPFQFLCRLLRSHLPNLERFSVPIIGDVPGTDSIEEAVSQGCPKLQHIICSWTADDWSNEMIASFIVACQGLKAFHCFNLNDWHEDDDSDHLLNCLLDFHRETLEEIVLENYAGRDFKYLRDIFYECKNLKKVRITPTLSGATDGILFHHKIRRRWACRDLKELHLVLDRLCADEQDLYYNASDEDDDEDDRYPTHDSEFNSCTTGWGDGEAREYYAISSWVECMATAAYGRIGQMVKLETLCLSDNIHRYEPNDYENDCTPEWDLTLDRGCLDSLSELKELRHFGMGTRFWARMGQDEVEFMDEEWPKLEKISFGEGALEDIISQPHWQWLQERRPYLEYCAFV